MRVSAKQIRTQVNVVTSKPMDTKNPTGIRGVYKKKCVIRMITLVVSLTTGFCIVPLVSSR
jgi:hypothetical protein